MLLQHRISAVPVVDDANKLVGIISEGDLLRRFESGIERRRPWWLLGLSGEEALADEYVKARGRKVADLMTTKVVTAAPDAPLHEVAALLERNGIKRVPIVTDGQLVGIVSRADLVQTIASVRPELQLSPADSIIRDRLLNQLKEERWARNARLSARVNDGVVDLWGFVSSEAQRKAIHLAAESTPGVVAVNDHLITPPVPFLV